ncbi:MAG: SLBB domain-containing protein, partial [Phycisphaerales bacterium]|nr:SLBB domain-containing protein [Phycisphaerales bacterium]
DGRGFIDIPQLGRIYVVDSNSSEVSDLIKQRIRDNDILDDPFVTVQVPGQRQATFSVLGAVPNVGRYQITKPDYRLLEALTDAGGVPPTVDNVYVIRQVPLSEQVSKGIRGDTPPSNPDATTPPRNTTSPEDLQNLLEQLGGDDPEVSGGWVGMSARAPEEPLLDMADGVDTLAMAQDGAEPILDLPGDDDGEAPSVTVPEAGTGGARWMFLDGQWVRATPRTATVEGSGLPEGDDPLSVISQAEDLVTQRVIRVPVKPLIQGAAAYNIVVRPGDVIRVDPPQTGVVYLGGPGVARPGTYNLPAGGKLTLRRAVISAGGLSAIGIPERVDLIRMVGPDRQGMVRLNYRAIADGTQPDILLKPDDIVDIGTNWWATPLAVVRGGFRASYGFGFLLDRNFGNDVFGPPPTNVGNR